MLKRVNKTQTKFEGLMTMLPGGFAVTVRLPRAVPTFGRIKGQNLNGARRFFPLEI
jgi:hypothetical protein